MDKLVSIIIPTFNRAQILPDTLNSVLNQKYTKWECIIVDNDSTDNTLSVLNKFVALDKRFKVLKNDSKGASISRNIGLKNSNGEYVQFLDSDDILAEDKIYKQIESLKDENEMVVSTCSWGVFYSNSDAFKICNTTEVYRDFNNLKDYFNTIGINGGFFPPHVYLIHKKLINISGFWNENLTMNDDGEFIFRILYNAKKIKFCNNTFVKYRKSIGDNLSLLNSNEKAKSLVSSWKIIESLYFTKFTNDNYIDNKKWAIYEGLKKSYPKIIKINKHFFEKEIKKDNLSRKLKKIRKKIIVKINKHLKVS